MRLRFQEPAPPSLDQVAPYYALSEAARWYSNGGPCHGELVRRLSERMAPALPSLVNNATSGLMIALRQAAGVSTQHRRFVVMPSFTFAATATAVTWAGFEPVLLDVDPSHWHLSPAALQDYLGERAHETAAILACTTFGVRPPGHVSEAWRTLAAIHGLPLIVDAAAGFGSTDEAGRTQILGDIDVYSFHATKPFAIGEGGMLATESQERQLELNRLLNFGFDDHRNVVGFPGINAKLSEIQCAFALAALDDFAAVLRSRREYGQRIRQGLDEVGFRIQDQCEYAATQFVAVCCPSAVVRSTLLGLAAERGIEVRTYFSQPIHEFGAYRSAERRSLVTTTELAKTIVSLPMNNHMSDEDIELVRQLCFDAARSTSGEG